MHRSLSHSLLTRVLFAIANVLLSLSQTAAATMAAKTEFPPPPCDSACSAPQKSIWRDYQAAKALDAANTDDPSPGGHLFSGECYHSSDVFDSEHAHHGVALLQPARDDEGHPNLLFRAQFSFFSKTNPYRSWSYNDADRELKQADSAKNRLNLSDDGAFIDFNPGQLPVWRYWLRLSDDKQTLFLIGSWGFYHRLFCSLARNAN